MSLVVSHLKKSYGKKVVVEDLSFTMERPGVYALLGTNGAGKTTSIRMMLNMLSRDGGEVLWNGKPLDTATCNVGYLAEERGLYPKYELMDQLLYFAALRGVKGAEAERRILSDAMERSIGLTKLETAALRQSDFYRTLALPTQRLLITFAQGGQDGTALRPAGIIKMLDLRRPIYKQTAAYGHFGRTDVELPWEKLDKVDALKKYL